MSPDQLADRIMARIERDQAIHKSSIVEELQLACAPAVKTMAQRDGYPVQPETGIDILSRYNAQIYLGQQQQREIARRAQEVATIREWGNAMNNLWGTK